MALRIYVTTYLVPWFLIFEVRRTSIKTDTCAHTLDICDTAVSKCVVRHRCKNKKLLSAILSNFQNLLGL